jgi:hypothetical protein
MDVKIGLPAPDKVRSFEKSLFQVAFVSIGLRIARISPHGLLLLAVAISIHASGQTSSTGALTGVVVDVSGKSLPAASVEAKGLDISTTRSTVCNSAGGFAFPLLPPGLYRMTASKPGFSQARSVIVTVFVTESIRSVIPMNVAGATEHIEVRAENPLQSDSIALGRVVDAPTIQNLPLATRNFTQIVNLSPGVLSGVNNAAELGAGGGGMAQIDPSNDGIFVHGSRSYDNGYEFDGIPVTDLQGSNIASGGVPIPNPDSIEEFKVQTGLYDVSFGEHAGASVSLVTKSGTDSLHGTLFEFARNDVLNANDFFFERAGKQRPVLKQNQFGLTLGGPIDRNRFYYFGSYQGTRQTNGLASGQARLSCSATIILPPFTEDRSPQAVGALFAGMTGAFGGVPIKPDGSNINPIALELLTFRLPNGEFLIPTPQSIDTALPFASQGLSAISTPCHFNEDQFLANLDASLSQGSRLSMRWMWSNGEMNVTFPGNGLNGTGNVSGFPSDVNNKFRVLSLSYVRFFGPQLLNDARFGYTHTAGSTSAQAPFQWSDLGVSAGTMNNENGLPSLGIVGSINLASGFPRTFDQERFYFSDVLTYSNPRHLIKVGGSLSRIHDDLDIVGIGSLVDFLSWPDFLLGMSGSQNGTNLFSNIYASVDDYGLLNRRYRSWNGSLYVGDHYRVASILTLDVGLRYERIGQFEDQLGRNSSFDVNKADPNPPESGSVAGYVVAANYAGSLPPGVIRARNDSANLGKGQNGIAPRVGFAWQPGGQSHRFVVRAGYGLFYSQPTGQAFFQNVFGAPFSLARLNIGGANVAATFAHPFPEPFPTANFFPNFPPYSPTSNVTIATVSPGFRPSIIQEFGLSWQVRFGNKWVLEAGYVGARGTHLLRYRSQNQALSASPETPVRGALVNTVANVGQRVPVQGVPPDALTMVESAGTSWYNGLETSLNKQFGRGLQGLASYTFSKTLDSDGSSINGSSAGNTLTLGDQNSPRDRWGRASFDRTHRFVLSAVYDVPSPTEHFAKIVLGGWSASGVLTLQSGPALTIAYTNLTNVFGISEDRAQLVQGCNKSNLVNSGSVKNKLGNYFNAPCFTTPPIIAADGIGTAFGNSSTGIANGPGQSNLDVAFVRNAGLHWSRESILQLRVEFFNALNHPQFSNPNTIYGSPSFGVISTTAVNSRVGQLAIKVKF